MRRLLPLVVVVLAICAGSLFAGAPSLNSTQLIAVLVAADGSGQFKTVQEAVMSVPAGTRHKPVVIRIKPGIYKELIYIQHEKRFFRLIGDDASKTVLTYGVRRLLFALTAIEWSFAIAGFLAGKTQSLRIEAVTILKTATSPGTSTLFLAARLRSSNGARFTASKMDT